MIYKRVIIILTGLFYILFSSVLSLPNADVLLTISPESVMVQTDANFTIQANISGTDIYGVQFDIYFNATILEAINVTEENFLKQNCTTSYSTSIINNTIGKIKFADTCTGETGVNGSGVLCNITFKAKSEGSSALNFDSVKVLDSELQQLYVAFTNGKVTAGSTNCTEFDLDNDTKIDIFDAVAGLEHLSCGKTIYNEGCSVSNHNTIELKDIFKLIEKI